MVPLPARLLPLVLPQLGTPGLLNIHVLRPVLSLLSLDAQFVLPDVLIVRPITMRQPLVVNVWHVPIHSPLPWARQQVELLHAQATPVPFPKRQLLATVSRTWYVLIWSAPSLHARHLPPVLLVMAPPMPLHTHVP